MEAEWSKFFNKCYFYYESIDISGSRADTDTPPVPPQFADDVAITRHPPVTIPEAVNNPMQGGTSTFSPNSEQRVTKS